MGADQILDTLATTQHGVVARNQLLTAGLSSSAVDRRLANGRLVAVYPGIYRLRGWPESWPQRLLAAVLACEPGTVASHRAAGFLHGLAGIEPRVEVTVTSGRGPGRDILVHRTRRAARASHVAGVPATGVTRTLIDLARVVRPTTLARALDDAMTRQLVTVSYLRQGLSTLGRQGRPGTKVLDALLDERAGVTRPQNIFERRLFRLLTEVGLPRPVPQYEVGLPGGRRAFVDFAYPDLRLALEADSYQHHSSKLDWERDRVRNRALTAMGWRILPVTWGDLLHPEAFLAELCTADPVFRRLRCTPGA